MDIAALYPSIDIERAATIVEKMINESKLAVDVDVTEMSINIASTHMQEEINERGLGDVCHTRRCTERKRKTRDDECSNDRYR
jgi:hypothetical protein